MNTLLEKTENSTDEWYTPIEIIESLGKFDLDPCAPEKPLWQTATTMYDKNIDGLKQVWSGRVWLNPPYSRPLLEQFMQKMVEHNNGIALLFNKCDSKLFIDVVLEKATAIKFLKRRIEFYRKDGTRGGQPRSGNILIAFGEHNAEILKNNDLPGKFIRVN